MHDNIAHHALFASRISTSVVIAFSLAVAQSTLGAQSPGSAFSVDDMLDVASVRVADVSDDGRWVAVTSASLRDRIGIDNSRFGDPTYVAPSLGDLWVIESRNGNQRSVFPEKRQIQDVRWSPDGRRMAVLIRSGDVFEPLVWENVSGRLLPVTVPSGKVVAENTELEWSRDSREVLLTVRGDAWAREARSRFESETQGPIAVLSSEKPFLFWEDLRRMPMTRAVVAVDIISGQAREVVPETTLRSYSLADGGREVTYLEDVTQKTNYDVIMGSENQAKSVSLAGGEPRVVIPSTDARALVWSRDNRHYAFRKDNKLYVGSIESSEPRLLAAPDDTASAPDADSAKAQSLTPVRLSRSGDQLVVSSKKGFWLINTTSGARELFLETPEDDEQAPRYEVMDWSADGASLFLTRASRTAWARGVVRYDLRSRRFQEVLQDARTYSGFQLSEDGSTWVFSASDGNRPNDVFAADLAFQNVRRLTDANQWLQSKELGLTELISYLDADGKRLHGVVYYPPGYKAGERYPTVFNVYEDFFDDRFNGTIAVLNTNGYVVVQPSVSLETGYPGEAWIKGVTTAANRVIEMGVADPERLGVQGTSYGGYAVNLLITQTHRFKAAVNISGKVNMVSFYTDSPRLGVRNIHAPEKSQDRLGATLWEQPQKYIAQSAIMFADRIETPLLLMTGQQDHNVPARQAMEMYYALRRLGKRVDWVNYINGGHGVPTSTVEEVRDYHARIVDWYNRYLKNGNTASTELGKASK